MATIGLQMGLSVDSAQFQRVFARAPLALTTQLRQLVEGGAIDVQREMMIQAPIATTGHLRGGVGYTIASQGYTATVTPRANYAPDVENGTPPHLVSVAEGTPLRKWAELKGANPYAVQRAIAARGTKANPFVARTYNRMQPLVEQSFTKGIDMLTQEINNARI